MKFLSALAKPFRLALVFPIFAYQVLLSPLIGKGCRFSPTCSRYAVTAILRHGVLRGSLLAGWRILRCNPYGRGGNDPVPPHTGSW